MASSENISVEEAERRLNHILNPQENNYNIATATEKACIIPVIKTVARRGSDTKENPLRYVTQYWSLDGELLAEKEEPI